MRETKSGQRPTKETLRSNIKDYIQKQIASGVYRPGDRIVEEDIEFLWGTASTLESIPLEMEETEE